MRIEEIINRLFAKFPGVEIIHILGSEVVEFSVNGNHQYSTRCDTCETQELIDGDFYESNAFSDRIEDILRGKVRNDAGEFV